MALMLIVVMFCVGRTFMTIVLSIARAMIAGGLLFSFSLFVVKTESVRSVSRFVGVYARVLSDDNANEWRRRVHRSRTYR